MRRGRWGGAEKVCCGDRGTCALGRKSHQNVYSSCGKPHQGQPEPVKTSLSSVQGPEKKERKKKKEKKHDQGYKRIQAGEIGGGGGQSL